MKEKKHIQNQFKPRHCEDSEQGEEDEAISQTLEDCHVGSSSLLAITRSRAALLLVNFGGPDGLSSVKPFLYNLFTDKRIIGLPSPFRQLLAWIISTSRNKSSSEMYKKIGSKSPLIPITYLQAQKLQLLFRKDKLNLDVFLGFRYSRPYIDEALNLIKSKGYEKVIVLPLYPQYSYTSTGSVEDAVEKWKSSVETSRRDVSMTPFTVSIIKDWYRDEDYIQSYVNQINNALEHLDLRSTELIFSAHSIPINNILNGDPYEKHINETVKLILEKLNWKRKWHIAYQSKIGPVKWLEPACESVIEEIAKRNQNASILMVPISFTCEHVETIYEIGMLYKEYARSKGIKIFRRVPALNTDKFLIQALYNQVVNCFNSIEMKSLIKS